MSNMNSFIGACKSSTKKSEDSKNKNHILFDESNKIYFSITLTSLGITFMIIMLCCLIQFYIRYKRVRIKETKDQEFVNMQNVIDS